MSASHLDGREHLVERMEYLLEKAKAGSIKAIAYVVINEDDSTTTGWRMNNRVKDAFVSAGVADLAFRLSFLRHNTGDEE